MYCLLTPLSLYTSIFFYFQFRNWVTANQKELGTSYQAVYNAAQTSENALQWAVDVQDDMYDYLNNNDQVVTMSTPAPTVSTNPTTVAIPSLVSPVTPDLPDSANTSLLSAFLLSIAVAINILI
jgi:hypothetical protein